ncbi:hypothetical protein CBS101457_003897 [Exobasidium rhododendri]|nr:hypothetical protein CBS101457_003897 [Exobasidium rhododendri]
MSVASSLASSPLISLILQSIGMLLGTLLCGTIPLHLPLSKTKLRVLEVMGAGLLVGASMTVVLPEGVSALFKAEPEQEHHHAMRRNTASATAGNWAWNMMKVRADEHGHDAHNHEQSPESLMGYALLGGFLVMFLIDQIAAPGAHASSSSQSPTSDCEPHRNRSYIPSHRPEALRLTRASSLSIAKVQQNAASAEVDKSGKQPSTTESSPEQMPLDHDQVSPLLGDPSRSSLHDQNSSGRRAPDAGEREGTAVNQSRGLRGAFASIAGLVIHAAADGIAMGASAGSSDESLKFIVLFAIMIHKAPAAFGLCTLLMGQRLHKRDIRKAILLFSMSTPIGAITTYLFLSVVLTADSGDSISSSHIGVALTFSAGTFIFVAMHAVQELASASADFDEGDKDASTALHLHHNHRHPSTEAKPKQILGRTGRVAVFLLGTILPKTLQSITGHSH